MDIPSFCYLFCPFISLSFIQADMGAGEREVLLGLTRSVWDMIRSRNNSPRLFRQRDKQIKDYTHSGRLERDSPSTMLAQCGLGLKGVRIPLDGQVPQMCSHVIYITQQSRFTPNGHGLGSRLFNSHWWVYC